MTKKYAGLAMLVAAPLLLGGCSLFGGSSGHHGSGGGGGDQGGSASETKTVKPQKNHTVASGSAKTTSGRVDINITELRRSGHLMTLEFTLTNKGNDAYSWQPDSGRYKQGEDIGGVTLIDNQAQKEYAPAIDNEGNCVCSVIYLGLGAGETKTFHATYGAPPGSVKKLDVQLPDLTTLHDVPIS